MATTTNYSWTTPDDTDLVKDGASAIRSLGSAIDSTVFTNAGNAVQKTIFDAKADLLTATAADTPAILAVGTDGQYLQADSSTATGLKWAGVSAGGETLISTTSLTGSTVSLTSIPGTYNALRLVISGYTPSIDAYMLIQFNGDSNANRHSSINIAGANLTAAFDGTSSQISAQQDSGSADFLMQIFIPDYANTSTWKFAYSFDIANDATTPANYRVSNRMALYNQTGAITSLSFLNSSGNFSAGSIKLYGVK